MPAVKKDNSHFSPANSLEMRMIVQTTN